MLGEKADLQCGGGLHSNGAFFQLNGSEVFCAGKADTPDETNTELSHLTAASHICTFKPSLGRGL